MGKSAAPAIDWAGLLRACRGYLGLEAAEPVPLAELRDYPPPHAVREGQRDDYSSERLNCQLSTTAGLAPTDTGRVKLLIPTPAFDSRGVRYYAPAPAGVVTTLGADPLADVGALSPAGHDAPEVAR